MPTSSISHITNHSTSEVTPLELLNLYLSEGKSKGDASNELYQKFNQELTWDAMLNDGYQQDLAPLLYHIITKTSPLTPHRHFVSDEITNKLKALYRQSLVKNMIQFSELDKILNAFEKEGIDVIQLKGAWIAKNYYPDPALRPMADLDLLVRKENMKRAKECLLGLGYNLAEGPDEEAWGKRHFHFPYIKHNSVSSILVELHHDIKAKSDFMSSNILEFWHKAIPISSDYKHILAIPKEYLILHLFWHTYGHLSVDVDIKIIYLVDIQLIINNHARDINWGIIEKEARKWKIRKLVYFVMFMVDNIVNHSFNNETLNTFAASYCDRKMFKFIMRRAGKDIHGFSDKNVVHMLLLNLIVLNTVGDKIKLLFVYNDKCPFSRLERIKLKYKLSSNIANILIYILYPLIAVGKIIQGIYEILLRRNETAR